jgi:hypothetical protein
MVFLTRGTALVIAVVWLTQTTAVGVPLTGGQRSLAGVFSGETSIRTTGVGAVRLRLPKPVVVSYESFIAGEDGELTVTGGDRVAGFAMILKDSSSEPRLIAGLVSSQCGYPECSENPGPGIPPFRNRNYSFIRHGLEVDDWRVSLPSGEYDVVVFGDGGPVEVTFRLPELTGVARMKALEDADVDLTGPQEISVLGQGAYAASWHIDSRRPTLIMSDMWLSTAAFIRGEAGLCVFKGDVPAEPLNPFMYGPDCRERGAVVAKKKRLDFGQPVPLASWTTEDGRILKPGSWSYGLWYRIHAAPYNHGSVAALITI